LTPDNATPDNFGWSVSGAGARINADGLVTANRTGTINVRATSPNGIFGEKRFVVVNPRTTGSVTFPGGTYATFDYNGTVWMVENLREGEDGDNIKTQYNVGGTPDLAVNPTAGERGYYYNWTGGSTICPSGWALPSVSEVENLRAYIAGSSASPFEKALWIGLSNFAGRYHVGAGEWQHWDATVYLWINDGRRFYVNITEMTGASSSADVFGSVRCVQEHS
jgi:hypothetical protein